MPTNTPTLGFPKPLGPDNARDYLKGAIAGGGLHQALTILDNAILSTSSITLDNVTLNDPTIGPSAWTNANHTHASAATAGSTLGPGTTLSTPSLTTPAVSGVMTFGGDATLQRVGAGALRVGGAGASVGLGMTDPAGQGVLEFLRAGTARWSWFMLSNALNSELSLYSHGAGGRRFTEAQGRARRALTLTPDASTEGAVPPTPRSGGLSLLHHLRPRGHRAVADGAEQRGRLHALRQRPHQAAVRPRPHRHPHPDP